MSAKPKALLKHAKSKKKEQALDDADDYLAAAVENEDAVGKHRAGAPVKSLRFARRAIELYEEGLAKWPRNLDLAYNKARLELEVATHPILVKYLDVPVINVLRQSLTSHQYALSLDQDNADALFNAAQVLTAIAEHVAKDDHGSDTEALQCLQQALEYLDRCLLLQREKYTETRMIRSEATRQAFEVDDDNDDGGVKVDSNTMEEEEQWVSVVEPVTLDTLVDTILAQVGTLTTLCSILNGALNAAMGPSPVSLSWIEAYSAKLNDILLEILSTEDSSSRSSEIALTKANFAGIFLELAFRSRSIDINIYKEEVEKAFTAQGLDSAEAHMAYARALLAFNGAVTDAVDSTGDPPEVDIQHHANSRWNTLSKAQKLLTSAASLSKSDAEILATTHMLRGDASLLLFALSYPPTSFAQAASNATQLLKNAEVFYRNANKLFGSLGQDAQNEQAVAAFRGSVVEILQSNPLNSPSPAAAERALAYASKGRDDAWRREQLQDMIDEGLVRAEALDLQ